MHQFKDNLDLSHLIGCEVVQVSHAPYNLLISLEPENSINIEGAWLLLDSKGQIIDEGNEQNQKDSYKTHRLLDHKIQKCIVVNPTTLQVQFDNGWKLEIRDDSEQYESCHISPDIHI